MSTNLNLQFICLGDDNMHIKTILGALVVGLSLGGLTNVSTTQAKTWHYKVTKSNQFSTTHYSRAFMYGGEYNDFTTLYKTATDAQKEENSYTIFSDNDHNRTFYARKISGNSKVMQFKYQGKAYYVNLNDAHLYRYNTWRSGHKLISTVKPTSKNVVLKAKTHVYTSQPWVFNYGSKFTPVYNWYKLSSKGNWYVYK